MPNRNSMPLPDFAQPVTAATHVRADVHAGHVLAADEELMWQGRPSVFGIARQALYADWIVGYFVLLTLIGVLRAAFGQTSWSAIVTPLAPALVVILIIAALSKAVARSTHYVITNRRAVIRFGAALPRSLSIPFSQVRSLSVAVGGYGRGDIVLATRDTLKMSFFKLWPHVRRGERKRLELRLRDVPDAALLATRLSRLLVTAETERQSTATHQVDRPVDRNAA